MELTEPIETINKRLSHYYGIDTDSGLSIFRVVWSEDQFENQFRTWTDFTPMGLFIREITEQREVKKYLDDWCKEKYILERYVLVPLHQQRELCGIQKSYEPLYVFRDKNNNYLPPTWKATDFVIAGVMAVQGDKSHLARYTDALQHASPEEALQLQKDRINSIYEEIHGAASGLDGTTISGESIIVPDMSKVN